VDLRRKLLKNIKYKSSCWTGGTQQTNFISKIKLTFLTSALAGRPRPFLPPAAEAAAGAARFVAVFFSDSALGGGRGPSSPPWSLHPQPFCFCKIVKKVLKEKTII